MGDVWYLMWSLGLGWLWFYCVCCWWLVGLLWLRDWFACIGLVYFNSVVFFSFILYVFGWVFQCCLIVLLLFMVSWVVRCVVSLSCGCVLRLVLLIWRWGWVYVVLGGCLFGVVISCWFSVC